jgi:tetratricopeptide (TPR) repeat protein
MPVDIEESVALGRFTVNLATARLFRDGRELELRPQAFRALKVLVQNPGRLVDYGQMIRDAWGGILVSKHTVAVTVGEIKNALKEYGSWITVRSKFGYCLEIPESEDLIVRGRHFQNQFTRGGFENALFCYQRAAERDGADFRALEAISNTHLMLGAFLLRDPRTLHRGFVEAQQGAIALRGLTWELQLDRAYGRFIFEANVGDAASELMDLQPATPRSAEVFARLAMVHLAQGRPDEALAMMRQTRATDLLVAPLAFVETIVRLFRREFNLAIQQGKEALDLHPGSQFGRVNYAEALEHAGRHEEATIQYHLAAALADAPWVRATAARFLAKIGRTAEALETLSELTRARETDYVDAFHFGLLLDALGRRDEAFQELERAYEERSYMLLLLDTDPKADSLRSDPRFTRLRDKVLRRAQLGKL